MKFLGNTFFLLLVSVSFMQSEATNYEIELLTGALPGSKKFENVYHALESLKKKTNLSNKESLFNRKNGFTSYRGDEGRKKFFLVSDYSTDIIKKQFDELGIEIEISKEEKKIISKLILGQRLDENLINRAFNFNRKNAFKVGDYAAVPRNDRSYVLGRVSNVTNNSVKVEWKDKNQMHYSKEIPQQFIAALGKLESGYDVVN